MDPAKIAADVLKELVSDIPGIAGVIHDWAGIKGYDLGPRPPDAMKHKSQVDADIDAQLEALKRRG